MPSTLPKILESIHRGKTPAVILVGGNNEFLTDRAFTAIREAITETHTGIAVDRFDEASDLSSLIDSFRTYSLFSSSRLLLHPEVNAFVTRKELTPLYEKAVSDWNSAKTDRKRSSSVAKLLHLLGLIGLDVDAKESEIAGAAGAKKIDPAVADMLAFARNTGKKASRGEGDAALLAEAVTQGGAPGSILLLKSGEIPLDSATVGIIDRAGAVVVCDLTRDEVPSALDQMIRSVAEEHQVRFDGPAIRLFLNRLGIERMLADKFSKEIPDLRLVVSEAERLATFVGSGGAVTPQVIEQQVATLSGGARYEFASLFGERKAVEAVAKLRDLIAQSRREDPKSGADIQYGKFLFPLAEEIRQLLAIQSFARARGVDLRRSMQYNAFKDRFAEPLTAYLMEHKLVRMKAHPFALHKRFEAARHYREEELVDALATIAELELARKSGGVPIDLGLETLVLSTARS